MRRKKLKELTIKDNFLFGAVMSEQENCRRFLELTLKIPIASVDVSLEKSFVYHPEYKGVRLDVYAKDEKNTHYNVEMQVIPKPELSKRARYYHGQMDMELLISGSDYTELPDSYVIFLCDFDPFGKGKYCYTFEHTSKEIPEMSMKDGSKTIFLSTCGENRDEVSEEMIKFLKFVRADLNESEGDFADDFVENLQESIRYIKNSRKMEERFMILEEMLNDERAQGILCGKREDILELLEELGEVPEEVRERIEKETNPEFLKHWHKLAARVNSVEIFKKEMF
ncbi:MAG: Rpn family recombination-promoting nuclease/putative transposase [Bacillota bacterium]|nr:Rpn family recombination-promoting nuclease/putative transposase [Bacillota bacterium]